ncbi:MAG TPA: PQQ-binding-like beta-propeller repeat protein, partial [Thermomicrobiales bacterium]|nr:PQQ-binding-like beta-propeller repeat protein [Thermomicrobiales bacterium]
RAALQTGAVLTLAPALARAQEATPIASPVSTSEIERSGWFSYGQDLSGDKAQLDGLIDTSNVGSLAEIWRVPVGGPISATPVISEGVVYVGSYDGLLYARELQTGAEVWTYDTGARVIEPNLQIPLGIPGSAHVDWDVIYVGDSAAVLHAVDRASGQAIWKTTIDDQPNACIWSSPVASDGVVYVGSASISKESGFRGGVVAVDAATGEIIWHTFVVPADAGGGGVFTVPAVDPVLGMVYVGTQNAYDATTAPYGHPIAMLALDTATGEIAWSFDAPPNDGNTAPTDDVGFSASPNLFTATIDGVERQLIGQGQKSGDFWVRDRQTGEKVWMTTVSPAGFLGGMEGTSAVANDIIVIPATDWPVFDGPASGSIQALQASTGVALWTAEQAAPVPAPVAISNDLVFHGGLDGQLHAYALTTGEEVWSADLGASVSGGAAIQDGVVVLGAATPQFAEFVKTGSDIVAFGVAASATPIASPLPVQATPIG